MPKCYVFNAIMGTFEEAPFPIPLFVDRWEQELDRSMQAANYSELSRSVSGPFAYRVWQHEIDSDAQFIVEVSTSIRTYFVVVADVGDFLAFRERTSRITGLDEAADARLLTPVATDTSGVSLLCSGNRN